MHKSNAFKTNQTIKLSLIFYKKTFKMKNKFLFILSLTVLVASTVKAQPEPTNYRGAFAPSPASPWTDLWVNYDPQNTFYAAPTVNVSGVITANTTWTKNNVYLLQGLVYVDSTVTLSIEAGTVIRGDANTVISSLIIERGATIIANGTACNPIVFTSSKAAGSRVRGDWGGLTILGRGITNQGTDVPIEGIGASEVRARYGGNNNADNSGSLKYIRIEYAGFAITPGVELNSLTFGGVGSATTVDYIQTSFGNDDAFEWFGGAVNCKHLVAYRTLDDDFDTDFGYSGTVQFGIGIKDPTVSDDPAVSTSEGFESDNNGTAPFTPTPKTSASFYNITQIGAFRCTSNAPSVTQPTALGFRRGARLRRNTELKIFNSILMNNWRGLVTDVDVIVNGLAAFQNNTIAMDTSFNSTVSVAATGKALFAENTATNTFLTAAASNNTLYSTPCDILINAWNFLTPDYRPNLAAGSTLVGCDLTPSIQIQTTLFNTSTITTAQELVVDVFEIANVSSNGVITVTIAVPPSFNAAVNGIATLPTTAATAVAGNSGTTTVLGADYNNTTWRFYRSGSNIIATSQGGFVIPAGGLVSLGLTIRRNTGVPPGTNQFLNVTTSGGLDGNSTNDAAVAGLGTIL